MKVRDIVRVLEEIAPVELAAQWDNVGLLIGDANADVRKLLLCIDLSADVLAEAGRTRAAMIMAYHPVIFKAIRRVTVQGAPIVHEAVQRKLAVYSMHTALDATVGGANDVLADVLNLKDRRPLDPVPDAGQCKVTVFLPADDLSAVADAAFACGAGIIGEYHGCSFFGYGIGTFVGSGTARPSVGQTGRHEAVEEVRLEMVCPRSRAAAVCRAIRSAHSYEEPAIDIVGLLTTDGAAGMGRIGRLPRPVRLGTLLSKIRKALGVRKLQLVGPTDRDRVIGTAACGAGACGDLWRGATAAGATLFLTGEMRHHDALAAAASGLTVVCVGHSNSERIALQRVAERLGHLAPKLSVVVSKADRDPFEIV